MHSEKMKCFSLIAAVAVLAVLHEAEGHHNPMIQMEDKCGCCPKPCCCHCVTKKSVQPMTSISASTTTTQPPKCYSLLDLAFCADSSNFVVSYADWLVLQQFIYDVSCQLPIGKDSVRIAVVPYSNNASVSFDFNSDYNENCETLWEGIKEIPLIGDFTNTGECLEVLADEVFPHSGRPDAPKVAIVITNGRLNFRIHEIEELAKKLQSVSDLVIAVEAGTVINTTTLKIIASGEGQDNVFRPDQFSDLTNFLRSLLKVVCEEPPPRPTPTVPSQKQKRVNVEECFCCCPAPPAVYDHHQQYGYIYGH